MKPCHLLLATTALLFPAYAMAQTASTDTAAPQGVEANGEVITITATRRVSSLQSTPVTVSALSSADLSKLGIVRVDQVASQVPNFYMQPGIANSSTISLSMRGRGDNAGGFGTTEQPVSFYFDDIYQARPSAVNSELADIERIEVLRGPQGTLFGRNSMVGAVNVITRTPENDVYGSLAVNGGNYETYGAKGAIGGPLVKDQLAASLSGVVRQQTQGYMYNVATGQDIDRRDFWGLRGKLHFYGSDVWDVVLAMNYSRNDNDGFVTSPYTASLQPLTGNARYTATTAPQKGLTKTFGASAHIVGTFDGFSVKSITAYSDVNDLWSVDLVGGTTDKFGKYVSAYNRRSVIQQHQFTEELQVYGDAFDGKVSWIGGLFYFTETTRQSFNDTMYGYFNTDITTPDLFLALTEKYYRNVAKSYAGYAQIGVKPLDGLELTFGGRYTHETKAIDGYFAPNAASTYGDDSAYNAFTPKFGANWQAMPNLFFYGSVSRGFRAGGYTSAADSRAVGETPYGPEKVWAYEIGMKSDWAKRRIRFNLTGFVNDFTDLLVGRFLPGTAISVMFNGLSYRVVGLEVEANVRPFRGLDIYANGGVQHASRFQFLPDAQITKPISIPTYSGTTGFRYETALGSGSHYSIRFGGDYVFRDWTYGDLDQTEITRTSTVQEINAEISIMRDDGWKLSVNGRNLADRVQWQNGLNFGFMGAYGRQPMLPRTVMAELSFAF